MIFEGDMEERIKPASEEAAEPGSEKKMRSSMCGVWENRYVPFCSWSYQELLFMADEWRKLRTPIRPDPTGLVPAGQKEISPCSEYTRFTVEGRFPGPGSRMNVLMESDLLGMMFVNGPFASPRWSHKLGYGMAVIGIDTRVHLYSNGKYVIRRALDRDHASRCLSLLASVCRPAVYSQSEAGYIWEILRDLSFGIRELDSDNRNIMDWQSDAGIDAETSMVVFRKMDEEYGPTVDSLIQRKDDPSLTGLSSLKDSLWRILTDSLRGILEGQESSEARALGASSYASMVHTALTHFKG
jgi:hypothetical protein